MSAALALAWRFRWLIVAVVALGALWGLGKAVYGAGYRERDDVAKAEKAELDLRIARLEGRLDALSEAAEARTTERVSAVHRAAQVHLGDIDDATKAGDFDGQYAALAAAYNGVWNAAGFGGFPAATPGAAPEPYRPLRQGLAA